MIQPEAGQWDKFRESVRFDDTSNRLEVRQSRVCSSGLQQVWQMRLLHWAKQVIALHHQQHVWTGTDWQQVTSVVICKASTIHIKDARFHTISLTSRNAFLFFLLRQQFEVCGILTNVFIGRHRNAREQIYGFVCFSNVKNSDKLSQALNNVRPFEVLG